jgi:serine protease
MLSNRIALAACLALTGCLADGEVDVIYTDHVHQMPYRDGPDTGHGPIDLPSAPAGAHLTYYGGKVIPNIKIEEVLYGSGTYISQLTSTSGVTMATFYNQFGSSGVMDWLSEYNTSSQNIGRGGYNATKQISPASSHNGSTISDASIQAELAAQINGSTLPAPSDNMIYAVHFPAGKTITQGGSNSCQAGGFCAYHGTFKIGSQNVYYAVLPDMSSSSGCATGCGNSGTFDNQTSVASHELTEAITDAEVGLSTTLGPPLAWYDNTNGEIGDICNAQQGTFTGADGNTYTIQQEFSNQQSDCITTRTTSTNPDFSVAISPSSQTVAPGTSTSYSVTVNSIGGSTQTVALSVSGLPSGVTGSFSSTSVNAGSSTTLTLTASSTASGSGTFTVKGTSGATSHSATASVTVSTGGGGGNTLSNGVPVTGVSGATGSQQTWTIAVPAGQASLTVTISGGTGDADLYVKAGSAPTLTTYDCRPYVNGNNETCTFSNPAAGTWYVMLNGYATYAGVTLVATYGADSTPSLTNGTPVTGIGGATGSQQYWKLSVPAGQSTLTFNIGGGTGDADLYVKAGAKPTTTSYDCRPYLNGNSESCTFNSPAAADYYVMLRGYQTFAGVSLTGTYH